VTMSFPWRPVATISGLVIPMTLLLFWTRSPLRLAADDAVAAIKLPNLPYERLIEQSVKNLQQATQSPALLAQKNKQALGEAYFLALVAQAGINSSDEAFASRCLTLQERALALARAISKKDQATAKKILNDLHQFAKLPPGKTGKQVNLAKEVPIERLMESVQATYEELNKARRLNTQQFSAKGKSEDIALAAYKLAALSLGITAHAPEKDPNPKEKQTRALWLQSTEDVRKACLDMAAAAKSKKRPDFVSAFNRMDSACTRCHDVYRVEIN